MVPDGGLQTPSSPWPVLVTTKRSRPTAGYTDIPVRSLWLFQCFPPLSLPLTSTQLTKGPSCYKANTEALKPQDMNFTAEVDLEGRSSKLQDCFLPNSPEFHPHIQQRKESTGVENRWCSYTHRKRLFKDINYNSWWAFFFCVGLLVFIFLFYSSEYF